MTEKNWKIIKDIELLDNEEITEETINELSNGKGDD